jgi:signal transduction histidine kinase
VLSAQDTADDKELQPRRAFSYSTRVTLTFALVAAMTAIIAAGVLALVWEQQFQGYTRQNIQVLATSTATTLAQRYELNGGGWTNETLGVLNSISDISTGTSIRVVTVEGVVLYNDALLEQNPSGLTSGMQEGTVQAAVMFKNEKIATVYVTALEGLFLTRADIEFRLNSYRAIAVAAVIAVLLATIVGLLFARGLVTPIKRITDTANAIKEGNLSARTEMGGRDEISQLGATLDAMAESIETDRELERRLTTDVAHELRTPLMAMQATIEAIVDGVLPADDVRLSTVNSEVIRLGRLVEALLRLSRLENRSVALKEEELDLGELIAGLVLSHEMLIEAADLSIEFKSENDVKVLGDADLLRQATANLISNAVRYTPSGGLITVEVKRGQMMAQIIVTDTGMGISEDDIKHVFSRFWRADAGRNRESGGLGVGLAVVKEIVDRHHGWVNVESILEGGTTFTIYIPLYTEELRRRRAKAAKYRRGPTAR